jgi:hypothetical protein
MRMQGNPAPIPDAIISLQEAPHIRKYTDKPDNMSISPIPKKFIALKFSIRRLHSKYYLALRVDSLPTIDMNIEDSQCGHTLAL